MTPDPVDEPDCAVCERLAHDCDCDAEGAVLDRGLRVVVGCRRPRGRAVIPVDRLDRLDRMIAEGRLLRGQWTQGHERACLLAALSPEVAASESARRCPAEVMPPWLAHLTVFVDDEPSAVAWPGIVRRYASLARHWHSLDDAAWERARLGALIAIVDVARSHVAASETQALAAIDGVLAWLRAGAPEGARATLWVATWTAAETAWATTKTRAAGAAAAAAAEAAEAAWRATEASDEATEAAEQAAKAAIRTAATAARATAAVAWPAAAARSAAHCSVTAADRIAAGVLDAIEREVEGCPRT